MMRNNLEETMFVDNYYFLVLFSTKITFLLKKKTILQEKLEELEELDCVDVDGIGNLEDLPRLVFIDEECENINKVVVDAGEVTRNINKKKDSVVLQAYRYPPYDKC